MVSLLTLIALGFLVWQWQQQHRELRDARRVLYRLLERNGPHTEDATDDGEARTSQAISRLIEPNVQRIQLALGEQASVMDGLQESLTQAITRLEELRQDEQLTSARLAELRANLPDGGGAGLARLLQRFHKEDGTQLERLVATQAQLAADLEALKDHQKRDIHLLRELSGQLADLHSRLAELPHLDRAEDRTEIETLEPPGLRSSLISRLEQLANQLQSQDAQLKRQEKSLEGWQQQLFGLRHLLESHARLLQNQTASPLTTESVATTLKGNLDPILRELARIDAPAKAFRQLAERMEQVWNALEPLGRIEDRILALEPPLQVLPGQLESLEIRLEQLPEAFARVDQQLEALPDALKQLEARLEQIEPINATAEPLDLKSLDLKFLEQRREEQAPATVMPQLWEKFFEQQAQILESLRASVVQTLMPLEERLVEKLRASLSSALEAGMGAPSLKAELASVRRAIEGIEVRDRLPEAIAKLDSRVESLGRLDSRTSELLIQLSGLQREVGLVLNARPIHSSGRAHNPFDANLALEYYNNLQKLVRVLMRNEKASTYALEALQYLYESLQLQASLTALLSSSEFAIRLTPGTLEESIVRPVAQRLLHLNAKASGEASSSLPLASVPVGPAAPAAPSSPFLPGTPASASSTAGADGGASGGIRAGQSGNSGGASGPSPTVSATASVTSGSAATTASSSGQVSATGSGGTAPPGYVGSTTRTGSAGNIAPGASGQASPAGSGGGGAATLSASSVPASALRPGGRSPAGSGAAPAAASAAPRRVVPPAPRPGGGARQPDPVADALILNGTPAFTEATHSTELPTFSELDLRGPVPVTLDARSFLEDNSLPDVDLSDSSLPIQLIDRVRKS